MRRSSLVLLTVALSIVAAPCLSWAEVVALKRSDTIDTGGSIDARFKTAAIVTTTVADAGLYNSGSARYYNYGQALTVPGSRTMLVKFDLSVLPGIEGARINLAELRLYHEKGNSGGDGGKIVTHDWLEGPCAGVTGDLYPGAAGGVSAAHPAGRNTGPNQNAQGGTSQPLSSWGPNSNSYFDKYADGWGLRDPKDTGPSGAGFMVFTVTDIVQSWADGSPNYGFYVSTGNWTFRTSENDALHQPVLFIDYDRNGPPNGVVDLTVAKVDWNRITLRWIAPADVPAQAVARYDIRYSTSPINELNFDAATPVANPPTPAAPGMIETFVVDGLTPETPYWFAIRCVDATDLVSPLAVVSATTPIKDPDAPAPVADLTVVDTRPNHVVLSWTASGDDGATGLAAEYDLRYSQSPILDEVGFAAATAVADLPPPQMAGSTETFKVRGLNPGTTYYFAIKVRDEASNESGLSNSPGTTTLEADALPPYAIADLNARTHIYSAILAWTTPADQGSAGCDRYDVRYSTSPIDEFNFQAATAVANVPAPGEPGTTQSLRVDGLQPDTTYYFAVKTLDAAEPANVSPVSNLAFGTTLPAPVPVTIRNPWLVNDRVADTRNIETMAATYVNAYTPDGVIPPANNEQKAINIYNNQKRRLYHWADEPPAIAGFSLNDPTYVQNVFGWALCGRHANQACTLVQAAGFNSMVVSVPGHWIYQVEYDGGWHFFDTMTTCYVYNRANPRAIASCAEIKADNNLLLKAVEEGRACPGFLLCGDTASWLAGAINSWSNGGAGGVTPKWTADMDLRFGETFERTWESWANQHPTPMTDSDTIKPDKDPPYHHEAGSTKAGCGDDEDPVNFPYWEPYEWNSAQNAAMKIGHPKTYRRWANGTYDLRPDFRSVGYQAMLHSSTNIATYYEDGLTPDLHPATAGSNATAVFKIYVPFFMTDAFLSGKFLRQNEMDVLIIQTSSNGTNWTTEWTPTQTGWTSLENFNIRLAAYGKMTCYVRIVMNTSGPIDSVGVSDLSIRAIFEHNKGAMAYLDKGVNNITLTFDNPEDLNVSTVVRLVYKWKEYDGTGWNIDRSFEQYVSTSPATFTINVGGTKVPRTESILLEVTTPPMPDPFAPDAVTDLAAGNASATTVPLSWTSTGDDGMTGLASGCDIRYSTTPLSDAASDAVKEAWWAAAQRVPASPNPAPPGTLQTFRVTGLQPLTTYYFAMKVLDEGLNSSGLSNVTSATTLDAPRIGDLVAGTPGSARVPLTWTAIGDSGTGSWIVYDLRYSTSPITDDASFDAATPISGVPAPKPLGEAESFTVAYLDPSTTYWFAIKAIDGAGGTSRLSNIVMATTLPAAAITDLAAAAVSPAKALLTWTAIDEGSTGTAASYDLRYSTTPIVDEASFAAATSVTGLPAPKPAGQAESFEVVGLEPATTYYFALKALDAVGRPSPLSNVLQITTLDPGPIPQWVGDLKGMPSRTARSIDLTWTAPADYGANESGPFAAASYDLRWSTEPITEANFHAATPVTGLPAPKAPGQPESFTVTMPAADTIYYFALKSGDECMPPNFSEISNCARARSSIYGERVLRRGLDGYNGVRDAYTQSSTPNNNLGGYSHMRVTAYADMGDTQRAYIRFDLAGVPADMNVRRATLSLYSYNVSMQKGSTGLYGVHRLTRDWTESGISYNYAASGTPWTTPGGDFEPVADALMPKDPNRVARWYDWDVTARVQAWLNNPSGNFGWVVKAQVETTHQQDEFYQSETSNTEYRPRLVLSDLPDVITGDVNVDGAVDVVDLLYFVDSFGAVCGTDRNYDPHCDLNGDGFVDVVDLLTFVENFGT